VGQQEPTPQVCDVTQLAYSLGNLHPHLKIEEVGNRDTVVSRMDYFQTLLDQALINYAAYQMLREDSGKESLAE
jgi:urease accessory protein UreE